MSTEDPSMGDVSQDIASTVESPKRELDKSFKRNLLIVGTVAGALILVALVIGVRYFSSSRTDRTSSLSVTNAGVQPQTTAMTPQMEQRLEEKQTQESEAAKSRNQSYIPPDPAGAAVPIGTGPGASSFKTAAAPVNTYVSTANTQQDANRREGLQRQLQALVSTDDVSGGVRQRIEVKQPEAQETKTAAAGASTTASSASTATGKTLIPGLEIVAGELANDIKALSNGQAYASARITAGPFAGAFLTGSAKVLDEDLEITFNRMRFGDKTYTVDAIVLDEKTANNAIDANVDHRIFQRYVFPVALAMAQGFFQAKAQTGSTVVLVGTGAAGVSQPAPSIAQAQAAGLTAGMQIAQQGVQQAAQKPLVVSQSMRYPVGIMFRAPVLEITK